MLEKELIKKIQRRIAYANIEEVTISSDGRRLVNVIDLNSNFLGQIRLKRVPFRKAGYNSSQLENDEPKKEYLPHERQPSRIYYHTD